MHFRWINILTDEIHFSSVIEGDYFCSEIRRVGNVIFDTLNSPYARTAISKH